MKFTNLFAALFIMTMTFATDSWGQCSESAATPNSNLGESFVTQSITAVCDGSLDAFTYIIGNNGVGNSATIELREGTSCSGNLITSEDITQVSGENTVSFSEQPMLTSGESYSFIIKDNTQFTTFFLTSDNYPGGRATLNEAACIDLGGVDYAFSYSMTEDIPVAAVPTMGEWALITFGLIIMSVGVVTVRRREQDFITQTA